MRHLQWIAVAGLAVALALGGWQVSCWRKSARRDGKLQLARELIQGDQATAALEVLATCATHGGRDDTWAALELEALARIGRRELLRSRYYRRPELFAENETASLAAARALLQADDLDKLAALRATWAGRETEAASWLALDADTLLARGQTGAALTLLAETQLAGADDAVRLTRLAILAADRPREAWRHLDAAHRADPGNATIRAFRGQLLESAGDLRAAHAEYLAAIAAAPTDAALRDQLAEFYRRQGDHARAVATWDGAAEGATDFAALKAWFWSRMVVGGAREAAPPCPPGPLEALVTALAELPQDDFWDDARLNARLDRLGRRAAAVHKLVDERQECFWLRLLDDLAAGRDESALARLEDYAHRDDSWAPELERGLLLALHWRRHAAFDPAGELIVRRQPTDGQHQLLVALDQAHAEAADADEPNAPPAELRRLLESDLAPTALLLAAGWREAALALCSERPLPSDAPESLHFGLAQALRYNRGIEPAARLLAAAPRTPALDLLRAELATAADAHDEARRLLLPLAALETDLGLRAAWMLGDCHLALGDADAATRLLADRPALAGSTPGRELAARVALARGRADEAYATYAAIADDSLEARVHLAQHALDRGDWRAAETQLESLLLHLPGQPTLRAGLQAVREAQQHDGP